MTTALFRYIDRNSYDPQATEPFKKAWSKVDAGGRSYEQVSLERPVHNLRGRESEFSVDNAGFAVYHAPSPSVVDFANDDQVKTVYYDQIKQILRQHLDNVKDIVIFDHTIRRKDKSSPRQPVEGVHLDQTPGAAAVRVRRHVSPAETAEELLKGRYQIINVWRPIAHPATDSPLAVIDGTTISQDDLVKLDLLYREDSDGKKESLPESVSALSTEGYVVKGETYGVAPNEEHKFYYVKDMTPDEVLFLKCFDSHSKFMTEGKTDIAHGSAHTAFTDPQTPEGTPGRRSIEVRCLVFYQ